MVELVGITHLFAGGCIATLCSTTGGVYYQYIIFFHFSSTKVHGFSDSAKHFYEKNHFFGRNFKPAIGQKYRTISTKGSRKHRGGRGTDKIKRMENALGL